MKKYILNTDDRKTLVNRLGELAGEKPHYTGMPRCAYECGAFIIEKNGDLVADDGADETILRTLLAEELVIDADEEFGQEEAESPADSAEEEATEPGEPATEESDADTPEIDGLTISLPMEGHTPESLRNLVNMIYSRGPLLSKATGGNFSATKELVEALAEGNLPVSGFTAFVGEHGGLTGLAFEEDKVTFTGLPMAEDPDRVAAFQQLACAMNRQAMEQKRIQAKEIVTESEKYTFRNWLVRIGMGGADCKTARTILLENLSGHTAFRNKAEEEKWKANMKAKRSAGKRTETAAEKPDTADD